MFQTDIWLDNNFKRAELIWLQIEQSVADEIRNWLNLTPGGRCQFEHISVNTWALSFENMNDSVLFKLTWL